MAKSNFHLQRSKEMEHRSSSHLLLFFTFLYVFCSQAIALPPLGSYSAIRNQLLCRLAAIKYLESVLGKRVENNTPRDEQIVKRQADSVFTDHYSRLLEQLAVKKYLESVIPENKSQEDPNQPNLQDEVELLEPAFLENYGDVTVDQWFSTFLNIPT
ncbi:VIP peptides [Pantherophis guttatus]|uniref:VIP peptides n=1 Tax=Pantherophis guttatus TaxID=94885 RepID=A0ABM3ZJQ7_PANGU|nr:VIP peptides [Pantherophis guttatus]